MSGRFRPDIEGLRALAILPILVFHLDPRLCPGGFVGVDIFFVISGYLISRMILDQGPSFSYRAFYLRRLLRLFPALLVTLLATMAAGWKYLGPGEFVALAKSALAAAFGVSNVFFLATLDYFNPAGASHPLLHTWSLGVEEQVYLLWPFLLLMASRRGLTGLAIFATGALSFALVLILQATAPQAAFYLMPFRLFEFAMGAALVLAERRFPVLPAGAGVLFGLAGGAAVAWSMIGFDSATPWPGYHALLPAAGTALLIVAGRAGIWKQLLSLSVLRFIGRISYSVYLVHWPLITLHRSHRITDAGLVENLTLGGASLALGLALYVLVETPFRLTDGRSPSRWPSLHFSSSHRLAGLATLLMALTAGSVATLATNGFPNRLDRARVQMLDQGLSYAGDICDQRYARCTFGAKDAERVVYLIGDSHALNLVHGLDMLFRELNVRGVALYDHGCLFAYGTKRFINGVPDNVCAKNIQRAYEFLASTRDPVIIASDYAGYRNEVGAADHHAPLRHDEAQHFSWLTDRLAEGLALLKPQHRPVLLVKQTYLTGTDLPKCLAQPGSTPAARDERCPTLSLDRVQQIYQPADRMIDRLTERFAVTAVDPKTAFCDERDCAVYSRDGRLHFRDVTHLTNEGSVYLIGKFRPHITNLLGR